MRSGRGLVSLALLIAPAGMLGYCLWVGLPVFRFILRIP